MEFSDTDSWKSKSHWESETGQTYIVTLTGPRGLLNVRNQTFVT